MRRCRRVDPVQNLGQDARSAEERQGTGQTSALPGEGWQEALLGDVLIIHVIGIFRVDVVLLNQFGQAECGSRKTVQGVQGPEDLFPRLNGQCAEGEALL